MRSVFGQIRSPRPIVAAVMAIALGALGSCTGSTPGFYPQSGLGQGTGTPTGEVVGNGAVRVALLLPKSAGSNAGQIATVFRNASELALKDFPGADVQVLVKDTSGTADGGRAAAQAAISEGAELILGPVFAPAVSGAAAAARTSGVPVIAFSSDASTPSPGVYLLSFLPQQDVSRIISYANSKGRSSYAALIPDNSYGAIAEGAFRQAVGRTGGRIVGIERYNVDPARGVDTADLKVKATDLVSSASRADAIFIPDGGGVPAYAIGVLIAQGIKRDAVKFLGSGQWDDPEVLSDRLVAGGWYPAPDKEGFKAFAPRYAAAYGSPPPRNATLAYDATVLAAGLVRSAGQRRFSAGVLTNRDGFLGIDGVFRFNRDGTNERGLAVYEAAGSGLNVISPAPKTFQAVN
ncbi:penicillin-binding protein activator [Breoghania sp.]|uniref:penicillin-binding protein activator n=1 Tax=Breoghania sp. TaxID=2065378 RepID=UPI00260AC192|nr:penicillin-binding protein activator [Breoghania sp.]MDJ0930394.1 penicillin-binding protein activator [Breoghania sp.]